MLTCLRQVICHWHCPVDPILKNPLKLGKNMASFELHSSSEYQFKLVFILQLLYPTVYTIYLITVKPSSLVQTIEAVLKLILHIALSRTNVQRNHNRFFHVSNLLLKRIIYFFKRNKEKHIFQNIETQPYPPYAKANKFTWRKHPKL